MADRRFEVTGPDEIQPPRPAVWDRPAHWVNAAIRFHYAWVIVAILSVVQVIGLSVNFAAGVLINPLSDPEGDFGFSLGEIGASYGMYYLAGAALAPLAGWLGDRYGARKILLAAAVLYGGTLLLVATMEAPWHLYLSFGLLRGAVQSIFNVPLMAMVAGWFRRRLGLGTGVLWAATGIGPGVMAPLLGYLLPSIGWGWTFFLMGTISGAALVALALLLRNQPSDMGIAGYGTREGDPDERVQSPSIERLRAKVFNRHIRRTKAFYNLPSIHFLGCIGHAIPLLFVVAIAVDRGLDLGTASWTLGIISFVSIPSRLITPMLAERYGPKQIMVAALAVQGLSVIYLFWAESVWEFFLFSALFGIGFGGEWTGYMVINRQYYGGGPMGSIYGWQITGAMLGHAFASFLAGVLVDITGSYNSVLVMSIVGSLMGVGVILTLEPTSKMLIGNWEDDLPEEARGRERPALEPNVTVEDD